MDAMNQLDALVHKRAKQNAAQRERGRCTHKA